MTEHEIVERTLALCHLADRIRMPSHRHSAESFMVARDELRESARRLFRDLTGRWPSRDGVAGPARRAGLPVPAAILRHRERRRAGRS